MFNFGKDKKPENKIDDVKQKNNNSIPIDKLESDEDISLKEEIIDFIKDLIIILIFVLIIRTYLIIPFQIYGQSMYDSFYDKEFIIVDRFSYLSFPAIGKLGTPNKGDVVVFTPKVDESCLNNFWYKYLGLGGAKCKSYYIKRIIGGPGDTLKIQNGKVYIKDKKTKKFKKLNEKYLSNVNINSTYIGGDNEKEYIFDIPDDGYFVMGDNRVGSTDSRTCFRLCDGDRDNYIRKEDIIGKVLLDMGYFNFKNFSFSHPDLGITTKPRFFDSPRTFDY